MVLRYEIIKGVLTYITQNPNITYDECVNLATDTYGFTEDQANFWISLFFNAICNSLGFESSATEVKSWINKQLTKNVTIDQLCDKLIAMVSVIWDKEGEIIVTREGQLYRKIQKYDLLELNQLQERKEQIENKINSLLLSDSELLEWAKENHPQMLEVKRLQDELEQVVTRIEELTSFSIG